MLCRGGQKKKKKKKKKKIIGMHPADEPAGILRFSTASSRATKRGGGAYDRHNRLLYGLILRILRDRAEAEEILQEVFVLVWTRAETYKWRSGRRPDGWCASPGTARSIGCARTACACAPLNRRRAGRGGATPRASRRSEQQRAVLRALEGLPPDQRVLIEQAYSWFTQSELADRLSCRSARSRRGYEPA